jgi:hypothetical protein
MDPFIAGLFRFVKVIMPKKRGKGMRRREDEEERERRGKGKGQPKVTNSGPLIDSRNPFISTPHTISAGVFRFVKDEGKRRSKEK